ncbi:MAG: cell division protein FtsZ [Bacteroidales bacterium]|nr:cell division protein FtsZ [Bacteroidales bacterium]MDD6751076.1 cell division protein FtsZ [Bacteroidales bacterium]MDY2878214.1 cell division protein FtsZ [Candidatus Cryptobacteroides sp.]
MTDIMDDFVVELAPNDWVKSDEIIKVMGVGGGGCNAVNTMYHKGISGCSFIVCNTDSMALANSPVSVKIQMGKGLGAGTDPIKGRKAALESQEEIQVKALNPHTQMLFITAGMGGGTGTGATPVIAKMAKDKGILTIAVVTLPFLNEGPKALTRAVDGIKELEKNVDSLIVINNEKLYEYDKELIHDAIPLADEVVCTAVKGIIEIIKKPGYINVDFEDVKTMMRDSGMALMGYGSGTGKNRIHDAVEGAFRSPLLNDFELKSARNVLVNITVGRNEQGLTMGEMNQLNNLIDEYTGGANNFKRGLIYEDDPDFGDRVSITSIVTGLKFKDVVGPVRDLGNYIMLTRDFVYDREKEASEEGIHLDFVSPGSSNGYGKFNCELKEEPALLSATLDQLSNLEDIPAIRRK